MRRVLSPVNAPLWSRSAIVAVARRCVVAVGRRDVSVAFVQVVPPPLMLPPLMAAPGAFAPLVLPPFMTAPAVPVGKSRYGRAQGENGCQGSQGQSAKRHDSLPFRLAPCSPEVATIRQV